MKCEICENDFITLDEHHIQSRSLGGSNKLFNIAYLCQNCHKKVHIGYYIVEGRFTTSNSLSKLVWRKWNESSITGFKDPPVFTYKKFKERFKDDNK